MAVVVAMCDSVAVVVVMQGSSAWQCVCGSGGGNAWQCVAVVPIHGNVWQCSGE